MSSTFNLGGRFAAALSAFTLSLVLISGTVTMPSQAEARSSAIYSGVVA